MKLVVEMVGYLKISISKNEHLIHKKKKTSLSFQYPFRTYWLLLLFSRPLPKRVRGRGGENTGIFLQKHIFFLYPVHAFIDYENVPCISYIRLLRRREDKDTFTLNPLKGNLTFRCFVFEGVQF